MNMQTSGTNILIDPQGRRIDYVRLSLSTNAVLLASQAEALRSAGIQRLNISLDTLCRDRFLKITGNDDFDRVLDGLMAARQAGFSPIKINMLALKGQNDDEVIDMAEFCIEHGFSLRSQRNYLHPSNGDTLER